MNTVEVVRAVENWATTIIPGLSSYDFAPEELTTTLPLVMAEVQVGSAVSTDQTTPGFGQYQQTILRVWKINLIFLSSPDPAWTASYALYGFEDAVANALTKGVRFASGVTLSQFYTANYNPPEVEYADGTKARQVTITVTVAQMKGAR